MHSEKTYIFKDIADSFSGFTLRNGIKVLDKGPIAILQPKDIQDEVLTISQYIDIDDWAAKNHLLKKGDLLLANKGIKFATFIFNDEHPRCIASASFFVIRTYREKCLPEFLQWYLQQPEAKEYLLSRSITTTIPSLSKAALGNFEIVIPTLEIQKKIIEIVATVKQEQRLLKQLLSKQKEHRDPYIWEMLLAPAQHKQ